VRLGTGVAKQYEVVYQRDETGWWQARVPQIPGCHTQGRTVEEARRRIREALSLFVDDTDTAEFSDVVHG
jgi:predicted RNase H-like HicB family nuclease